MDRFIKTLGILIIMLFLLATGIDATLDHFARAPHQDAVTAVDGKNAALTIYSGDLNHLADVEKSNAPLPRFLRRVKPVPAVPPSTDTSYSWL